jgi:hypothetical protein
MFTVIGFAAVALVGSAAARQQPFDSDDIDINAKQTRLSALRGSDHARSHCRSSSLNGAAR